VQPAARARRVHRDRHGAGGGQRLRLVITRGGGDQTRKVYTVILVLEQFNAIGAVLRRYSRPAVANWA
jgi:hypothetical protein